MRVQYVLFKKEVDDAKNRLDKLKWMARMAWRNGELEEAKELNIRAGGFEEAMIILGIVDEIENK